MEGKILLCEFARVTDNGLKYDVIGGGITTMQVPQFPFPVPFALLLETKIAVSEAGRQHAFEIKIIDPDGKLAAPPITGNVGVNSEHKGALYAAFNLQLLIKKAVSLTFSFLLNGEEKDSATVEIKQVVPMQLVSNK